MNLGEKMLKRSEQERGPGVIMHKNGRSTTQCAEAAKRANRVFNNHTRYDKEDSNQQREKHHIKVV